MRKLFSTSVSENAFGIGMLLIRIIFGSLMMVQHGLMKLTRFSLMAGKFMDPFHVGPTASLSLTVFAEFFCAAFIILGLFTRIATIPLIIAMCVALFLANKGQLYGDGELAGVYLVVFLAILIMGPGKLSLDRFIGK